MALLGSTLVEIKATIRPRPEKTWVYQLIGYALLDYGDQWGFSDVAFYFPRQGILVKWNLVELLRRMSPHDQKNHLRKREIDLSALRSELAERLSLKGAP